MKLTNQQIKEWQCRVHLEYAMAAAMYRRAVWREGLLKRYLYRCEKDNNNSKENADNEYRKEVTG